MKTEERSWKTGRRAMYAQPSPSARSFWSLRPDRVTAYRFPEDVYITGKLQYRLRRLNPMGPRIERIRLG